jgi:hypothetical protein
MHATCSAHLFLHDFIIVKQIKLLSLENLQGKESSEKSRCRWEDGQQDPKNVGKHRKQMAWFMGMEGKYSQVRSAISLKQKYWFNWGAPDDKQSDSDELGATGHRIMGPTRE